MLKFIKKNQSKKKDDDYVDASKLDNENED
jgi:hypothetical protein